MNAWKLVDRAAASRTTFPWLVLACVVLAVGIKSCRPDGKPLVSPETAALRDSLTFTRADFANFRDSTARKAAQATKAGQSFDRKSVITLRVADTARTRADVAIAVRDTARTLTDSLVAVTTAYDARTGEALALRVALAQKDSANSANILAAASWRADFEADTARRVALERLNAGLEAAIVRAQKGCRIAGLVSCPSRPTVALVSLALGVGVGFAVKGS